MKIYLPFTYRGYKTGYTVDIPQKIIDDAIQQAISHHEEMFNEYGYDYLFDEYKKIYNNNAVKNETIFPDEYKGK